MPDPVSLTGPIKEAIDGALLRGHQLALAYVREDGSPAASFRGSTHVHSDTELAIWVRKTTDGFAVAIAKEPRVSFVYTDFSGPGTPWLSIDGRARTAPELGDEVYDRIPEPEKGQDPDKKGVAVIIEVDIIRAYGAEGYFEQHRG